MCAPPYINPELRKPLEPIIEKLEEAILKVVADNSETDTPKMVSGCLAYTFFKLMKRFYMDCSWYYMMDAVKACDAAKMEFVRRFVDPHEQKVMEENSDV